jgi:hypothetical protein
MLVLLPGPYVKGRKARFGFRKTGFFVSAKPLASQLTLDKLPNLQNNLLICIITNLN